MQHTRTQDTLVGLFVASGIAGLFFISFQISNLSSFSQQDGYTVTARFENSGGLKVKSPVSAAGVKIGHVSNIHFDTKTYESVVTMSIEPKYNTLPDDTTASIFTAGLLGEQYVNLEPGGSSTYLKNNGAIDITQPAIILEKAMGQFLFKAAEEKVSELQIIDEGSGNFAVDGELTFLTIDKNTVKSLAFLTSAKEITVDLSRVSNADSAALALMIEWIRHARGKRTPLRFKKIPKQLLNLAKLSGLDDTCYFSDQSDD